MPTRLVSFEVNVCTVMLKDESTTPGCCFISLAHFNIYTLYMFNPSPHQQGSSTEKRINTPAA
jgi:hypothetical protein